MKCDYVLLLYADYAVVFAKSPEVLQSILHEIELYCTLWTLKINTRKPKAMIFEKGSHTHSDFYLDNVKLKWSRHSKILRNTLFQKPETCIEYNNDWHNMRLLLCISFFFTF